MTSVGPLRRRTFGATLGIDAGALATIAAAWFAVSGRVEVASQLGWVDAAVIGTVAAAVGNGAALVSARRAIVDRRRRLLATLVRDDAAAPVTADSKVALLPGDALRWFHAPACALVLGKPHRLVRRPTAERRGRSGCPVCQP